MRDAAGVASDRFHPFGLSQLLLQIRAHSIGTLARLDFPPRLLAGVCLQARAPMKPDTAADAGLARKGEQVYQAGKPGAPACKYCHGANGEGLAPVFARLAGQHAEFVYAALQPYQDAADFKNPYAWVMKGVVENLSDEDLKAVAAYISGLSSLANR